MRFLATLLLILFHILVRGQSLEETDTLVTEPYDTAYKHQIAFCVGGGLMYSSIENAAVAGSEVSATGSSPYGFISFGFIFHKELKKRLSFESGVMFNISRLIISYDKSSVHYVDTVNYSTMAIPLGLTYKPAPKPSGLFFSGNIVPQIDISKRSDKNNRIFPLRTFAFSLGLALGYRFKTLTSLPEIRLFADFFPENMLIDENTVYTEAVKSLHIVRIGILLSIR